MFLELLAEDIELADPRLRFLAELAVDAHIQGPNAGEEPPELLPFGDHPYVLDHALAVGEGEDGTHLGGAWIAVEVDRDEFPHSFGLEATGGGLDGLRELLEG